MPGGYFVRNLNNDRRVYELTDETVFNFVDFNLLFIDDEYGDRQYTTTDKDEFILHLMTNYHDRPPAQTVPFFLEIQDGRVVSVTENFAFTL